MYLKSISFPNKEICVLDFCEFQIEVMIDDFTIGKVEGVDKAKIDKIIDKVEAMIKYWNGLIFVSLRQAKNTKFSTRLALVRLAKEGYKIIYLETIKNDCKYFDDIDLFKVSENYFNIMLD